MRENELHAKINRERGWRERDRNYKCIWECPCVCICTFGWTMGRNAETITSRAFWACNHNETRRKKWRVVWFALPEIFFVHIERRANRCSGVWKHHNNSKIKTLVLCACCVVWFLCLSAFSSHSLISLHRLHFAQARPIRTGFHIKFHSFNRVNVMKREQTHW